jgi:hypothetical protein
VIGSGNPNIALIQGAIDPSVNPYNHASPYLAEPMVTSNGITWYIFHNPQGGKPGCDLGYAQALMPNGKDVIGLGTMDEDYCPGNPNEAPSVVLLKQILSTFKFTN